ncbi:lipid-A-disaccharide synthase [Cyanobacterium stanieri LEGE 03274]|uniref:Lipid-A-disaccharide synthase n=1 Tax=Cyanobacterium stanieri LEGE 03274 TaxID=1828756 RepID=A0ABR9V0U6_9CHRO|nr:lipid-A-disaccharide synthase [Cyanobacterium stanieri]MBE9221495.1 lipid-A-disaccharide synthase [Cyanobacterium stanieri LEGE 03274]
MRIFISTGEVSGDLQGGLLTESLLGLGKSLGLEMEISGLGGQKMATAGVNLIADTTAIGSVGLLESLPFIIPTWRVQRLAKKHLRENLPDVVVLIDYLGPNLSIGSFLKDNFPDIPIIWYIAPQFWVWTPMEQNVNQLVNVTDRLLAIFPQEAKFYEDKGVSSTYVGHPLLEKFKNNLSRDEARSFLGLESEQRAIALIPASRKQELKYLLPVMLESAQEIAKQVDRVKFFLPVSLPQYRPEIESMIKKSGLDITLYDGNSLELFPALDLAITKSGTVNLELALLKIPQVVIYKVNPFTIWVGRTFLKFSIPYMSMANLVLMENIVPELLQEEATVTNILTESLDLLLNGDRQKSTQKDYQRMIDSLHQGNQGILATEKVAQEIINITKK